jgi:hypothetical protein
MIAAELVRHLLVYDPETGVFRWKNNRAGTAHMARAGCVDIDLSGCRRRRIRINGKHYKASDLAWLYMTGEWPVMSVDHRNQVGDDDQWDNLRLATRSQQMMNRRDWGKEWPKGVAKSGNRFMARIQIDKKSIFLGTYATVTEAKSAYDKASLLYHGAFSGVN